MYVILNRDFIMAQLGEIYRNASMGMIYKMFLICYSVDFVTSCFAFSYGFKALYTHKVKTYNTFNVWLLLCVFCKIVISYLNV